MKIDSDFAFVPFDKPGYIFDDQVIERKELYALLESDDVRIVDTALLYTNVISLDIINPAFYYGASRCQVLLPDYKFFQLLWNADCSKCQREEVAKRLVSWYIGYEASTEEEMRIHFMAKILGERNGLVRI